MARRNVAGRVALRLSLSFLLGSSLLGSPTAAQVEFVGWGNNQFGQASPLPDVRDVVAVSGGGAHTLALKSDGTVVGWGSSVSGASLVPPGLGGVTAVAAGTNHSLALKSDGTVVAWGYNVQGQTTVPPGLAGVTAIAAGNSFSLALKSDGTVVVWGYGATGQVAVPPGLTGVAAIAVGTAHVVALKTDGTVVAWGSNLAGQATVPPGLAGVTAIAAGGDHSLALRGDGTVVAWGSNAYGEGTVPAGASGVTAIAAGVQHNLALRSDGTVVAWGLDNYGQAAVPMTLAGVTAIAAGSNHSLALKGDGTVAAWGDDTYGQANPPRGLANATTLAAGGNHTLALLGDGTVRAWGSDSYGESRVPAGLAGVVDVAAGEYHSLALRGDGTVVAWGNNGNGQATVSPGLGGVIAIAAGGYHNLALKSDGTVVGWGRNVEGQTNIPAGLTGVAAIAAGYNYSLALRSDGTVVAWGWNLSGETNVPPGLSGVTAIAAGLYHGLALRSDGTVVGWGSSSPATVPGGLSGVTAIAGGYAHSLALEADGTVVAWGLGLFGEQNVPPGLDGVFAISAGTYHSVALRSTLHALTVAKAGAGTGTVTSTPPGIDCGPTCSAAFAAGSSVTLTAVPAAGSAFAGWSGDCSGMGDCVLAMDATRSVTGTFLLAPGVGCSSGADCASGFCVDGLCCDRACSGQCEACDVAGSLGACTPVVGAPHGARAACLGDGSACNGSCDGIAALACTYPGPSTNCSAPFCVGGMGTLAGTCTGAGSCGPGATLACQPYVCGATACLASCATDADCVAGYSCGSGACLPAVSIADVAPSSGPAAGGTVVTVTGASFETGAAVTVGGAAATGVSVSSATSLTFTAPPGSPGWADVTVTLSDGRHATAAAAFQYIAGPTIASISPASGPAAGGTTVTITGSGFLAGATVSFGGMAATTSSVVDVATIVAVTPPGANGSVDVVVQNPDGQSATLAGAFTYLPGSASEELLVANWEGHTVTVYDLLASGNAAPLRTLGGPATGIAHPVAMAIDRAADRIYVASELGDRTGSIAVFDRTASGDVSPMRVIAGQSTRLQVPTGLAVDVVHQEILVANLDANRVTVYSMTASGDVAPIRVIEGPNTGLAGSFGLALDAVHDEILVANYSTVTVYFRTASGDAAPLRTIQTSLYWANGISVSGEEIFVSDRSGSRVAVYARTADGSAPPLRVIEGPTTGIAGPVPVIVDAGRDEVLVGSLYNQSVGAFPRGAGGDAAPGRAIQGPGTGLSQPHALVVARPTATFTLTASRAGIGAGTVTSAPAGIDCGTSCSASLPAGSAVELSAAPAAGSAFAGWSGDCTGTGPCVLVMDAARSATATFLRAAGAACSTASDCGSGSCADGVCCDQACTGQCEACDAAGSAGTCVAVTGQPHGSRPACASDGTACGGACDGSNPSACAYPGASISCRSASCSGGMETLPASCDGAGSCGQLQTQTCGSYMCGPTACLATCAGDAECVAGFACTNQGECLPAVRITTVAPDSGPATGGTRVTLAGLFPGTVETVTVGGTLATEVSGYLSFTTPPGAPGWADIVVTLADGRHGTAAGAFQYLAAPTISAVSPTTGPAAGGTTVTIGGSGFVAGATVSFGGVAAGTSSVVDSSTIVAVAPPGPAGAVDIAVQNPDGQSTVLPRGFAYVSTTSTYVVAWGSNTCGQTTVWDADLSEVAAVAAGGRHSVVLRSDGTVVAWGDNSDGQSDTPAGLSNVTAVAAGTSHSVALKSDGTVVAWGYNRFGQVAVPAGLSGVIAIAAGDAHTVALQRDGTVVAWGDNRSGQSAVPPGLSDVTGIAAGAGHTVALKRDGTVVAWGSNAYGQTAVGDLHSIVAIAAGGNDTVALGADSTIVARGPVNVPPGFYGGFSAVAAGGSHVVALHQGGTGILGLGDNTFGQIATPSGLAGVVAIAAGGTNTVALKGDGTVVAWGDNRWGQTTVPTRLPAIAAIAAGACHNVALSTSGTVVAWGGNGSGQSAAPGVSGAVAIAAGGDHNVALRYDSSILAWGDNAFGQASVPGIFLFGNAAVATGDYHTVALRLGGTVVAWGDNRFGQTSLPPGLSNVVAVAAGSLHTVALLNDGTVVAWGENGSGQATVPAGLSGVTAIAAGGLHSVALRNDGTVVAWGENGSGQATVPAGLSGVTAIAAGGYHTVALKSDGTVVAWGNNAYGQATVPAGLSGVTAIAAGWSHTVAMTTVPLPPTPPPSPPAPASASPTSGFVAGGTAVTIGGSGFQSGATVLFGGIGDAAGNVTAVSPTSITVTAPAHAAGTVDVVVRNPDGQTGALPAAFTYVALQLTSLSQPAGPEAGGTQLSLVGSGFVAGMTVTFGAAAPVPATVLDGANATCVTPAGTGTVDVTVTVGGLSSTLSGAFTYVPRPTVTSVSPASGSSLGGTSIVISGTRFLAGASVTVGGQAATSVVVASPTQITAVTPPHAAGTVGVTVANAHGDPRTLARSFTYVAAPAPVVQAISPASGPTSGGTPVTVTGTGFAPGATLTIGGVAATDVVAVSSASIAGITGPHAAGNVAVTVRNPDNQAGTLTAGYRYLAPPTITGLNPAKGSLLGGTVVAISGSGFQSGATVAFDGLAATVTSVAGATIRVTTPAHALGVVNVAVLNPDGQSGAAANAYTYVPATPTGLTATGGQNQISLTWSAAAGATGYDVLRSTANAGPYTYLGSTASTSHLDSGLADGVRWFYVVQATASSGSSASSASANAWTIPAPPAGLTATPGPGQVTLSWSASTGATRYRVYRGTVPGGPYAQIANITSTTTTDGGRTPGATYYYIVRAQNSAGLSGSSSEVSATAQ